MSIELIVMNPRATADKARQLAGATEQDERLKEFATVLKELAETVERLTQEARQCRALKRLLLRSLRGDDPIGMRRN